MPGDRVARWRRAVVVILPAALALGTFWPATRNGFVWDDPLVLRQLRAIRSAADLVVVPPGIPHTYYRPVVFLSYLVDRALGGEQPFWFHASVVLWHALASALLAAVARVLLARRRRGGGGEIAAVGAALLFAVHPVHVESVSWMAGRSDVIACTLLLAALLLHAGAAAHRSWLGALLFFLSCCAKEVAVPAVVLFPLLDWSLDRRPSWARTWPALVAAGAYLALRRAGLGVASPPSVRGSAVDCLGAFGFYAARVAFPFPQTLYADAVPVTPVTVGAALVAALCLGAVLLWAGRGNRKAAVFAAVWYALALAPALALAVVPVATAPVAERYLYVPSAGALLLAGGLLGEALSRRPHWSKRALAAVAGLALAGVGVCMGRNEPWRDELAFWRAAAAQSRAAMPQRELADAYFRRGDLRSAERAYLQALERPGPPEERAMALANLGNLYRREDRVDEAIQSFQKAASVRPHPGIFHGLGLAWMRKAELADQAGDRGATAQSVAAARHALETALALGERQAGDVRGWEPGKTHILLGQVLLSLGDRQGARAQFEMGLQFEPEGAVAETARRFLRQLGAG